MKRHPSALPYPFARAIEANGFLFLSGQLSMSADGKPLYGSIEAQTHTILQNIIKTLEECNSSLDKAIKVTTWLSDMEHFSAFNDVYRSYFPDGFPARTTVSSTLAFGLDVEVEVQALT